MRSAWGCQPVGGHEVTWAELSTRTVPVAPGLRQEPPTPALRTQSAGQTEEGAAVDQASDAQKEPPPGLGMEGAVLADMLAALGCLGGPSQQGPQGGHPAQTAEPSDSTPSWTPPSPQPHPFPLPTSQLCGPVA